MTTWTKTVEKRMEIDLTAVRTAQAEGRFADAEQGALACTKNQPENPEGWTLLGAAQLAQGNADSAIEAFRTVISLRPDSPQAHSNFAEALRVAGRLEEAMSSCQVAISIHDNYPEAHHNLGAVTLKLGNFVEAEQAFKRASQLRPNFASSLTGWGDAYRRQGRWREAAEKYREAIAADPAHSPAHANLGLLLACSGMVDVGLEHCRRAVELRPHDRTAVSNLGRVLAESGQFDEAMESLENAIRLDPDSADLALSASRVWFELGDYQQAIGWADRAARLAPELEEARCLVGAVAAECGDPEVAEALYRDVLTRDSDKTEAIVGLARALLDQGDVEGAVAAHQEAIDAEPDSPVTHSAFGHTLATAGKLDAAVAQFRAALTLNPRFVPALGGVMTTLRGKTTDDDIQIAQELLAMPRTDARRASLEFGLGQAFDGRGEYSIAAEHIAAANAAQGKHWSDRGRGYDPTQYTRFIDRLIEGFTPAYFKRIQGWGDRSIRPIFIVGMPRSGTTLTEQILASHPQVHGAGERRFLNRGFLRLPVVMEAEKTTPIDLLPQITREAVSKSSNWHLERLWEVNDSRARVVDKMPENFQLLGWIATLFPNAAIIHCVRDVRDIALSCWVTNFASIPWANDLKHIAHRINEYRRILDHYRSVLPVPVHVVEYEKMVADQEGTTRQLLDFVGLEWEPSCLEFYQTERLVRTASVSQVRQPIYSRSVERWRRYESALAPLLETLRPEC